MLPPPQKSTGFTLLEVLISVLILAFGLLGLAGLQGAALKNNHSSYLRSLATEYAYDLSDRIRANASIDYSAQAAAALNCTVNCTPTQMAQFDLNEWQTKVLANLPTAGTNPTLARNAAGIYTLTISWDDNRTGSANTTFSTSFKP